jgi:ubiquinone/menaquinone biosynthesis C-methylase UbiE
MAEHVCPVWVGYLLACPLRKLVQNPKRIVGPYVKEGMNVLDIGCAMGFFSLPIAGMVGAGGRVVCVDVQPKMIASLEKRAKRAGLSDKIEARLCPSDSLGVGDIKEEINLAIAFAVVHEVPDAAGFFSEVYGALKPGGRFLVAEPRGRVSEDAFAATVSAAERTGFSVIEQPQIKGSRAVLLGK